MIRRLSIAGCCIVASVARLPAQHNQGEKPVEKSPVLLALSRELAALRKAATARVFVYGSGRRPYEGVYLGDGLVATCYVADATDGSTASMRGSDGTAYRLISVGADRRLKLASFFKLRDWPLADAKTAPRPPAFAAKDWRGDLGDLVYVVGARTARLDVVQRSLSFGRRRSRSGSQRSGVRRTPWLYRVSDGESKSGSAVLAMDGKLVGLFVRHSYDRREPPGKAEGQEKTVRPGRTPSAMSVVVDGRWLLARAKRRAEQPRMTKPTPSFGVTLINERDWAMMRARRRGGDPGSLPAAGLRVTTVFPGGPAHRAGVESRDLWIAMNGKKLTGRDQVRDVLAKLEAGGSVEIEYRRGGIDGTKKLRVKPD